MKIYKNPWKYTKVYEIIYEHITKTNEIPKQTTMEIDTNIWEIFWGKRQKSDIVYSKNIEAPHICPLQRNHMFEQRT